MSCKETFIPRTKLEERLAKEFGMNNKDRDTLLALSKSDEFKSWYKKREDKEFNENGDGRSIYPALRRYYNNKFFSVNANTTIRNDKGRFSSHNARQLAIDYIIGNFIDKYSKGSRYVDTDETIYDEEGNEVPNPNYGKLKLHRFKSKDDIAQAVVDSIYFIAKDAMDNIIESTLPESVREDFRNLLLLTDDMLEDSKEYKAIISKYAKDNNSKIVINDGYDLAAVLSNNDKIVKILRDRYLKKSVDSDYQFDYSEIMRNILTNNQLATVQQMNQYAMYDELSDGIESDFLQEVYDDNRMNIIVNFGENEEAEYDEENGDPDDAIRQELEGKENSEGDNTIAKANSHMGAFNDFMKHVDNPIKAYLGQLDQVDSIDDMTPDTNNELGLPMKMNVAEVCTVLYQYTNKTSPEAMRESIARIARDIPGMKGLMKIYNDTSSNSMEGLDLLFSLYTNFGKIPFGKSQVIYDGEESEVKVSNERGLRINALRLTLLNEFRGTGLTIDSRIAEDKVSEINNLINNYNGTEESRTNIIREINNYLNYLLPSLTNGTVSSYTLKDGADGFKNNAKALIGQIRTVTEDIINLQISYESLREEQREIYKEINSINIALDKPFNLDYKKVRELQNKRNELRKKLGKLYAKDYTSKVQSSIFNLSNTVIDNTLVRTDLNSPNIHGDMSSDIINNNMMTNLINTLQNSEALKNYGDEKFKSEQYRLSNILVEKVDDNGNIINFGLFRLSTIETVNEETGEIIEETKYVPTEYAKDLISFELFDGAINKYSGVAALYSEMTKSDYIATAFNEFFKEDTQNNGEIKTARYFTRIPSDAPKTFVMRAPKYDTLGLISNGVIDRNHPVFKQMRNMFEQEVHDAVTALSKFFVIENGKIVIDYEQEIIDNNGNKVKNPNYLKPKFKQGWSNETKDARKAFDIYHTKTNNKTGKTYFLESIDGSVKDVEFRLVGRVFTSDKFVISTNQKNYLQELIGEGRGNGVINFLYGREQDGNSLNIVENVDGTVSFSFNDNQNKYIDEAIENFIKDYVKDCNERFEKSHVKLDSNHNTEKDKIDFAINTFLMYNNFNDLLEGNTKFYKNSQDFLKRAKEMQASGIPYGIVSYDKRTTPNLSIINSRLSIANIIIGGRKIELRNGFRGVTIKNTIRTSEEADRLFGTEKQGFKNSVLVQKGIIDIDGAKRLKKLYSNTKTNDAQSYITLDEWIRRVTAQGQFARYENLIRKLIDPNYKLTADEVDEFVQVQKNFYYDQHYNKELGVTAPRQIKNAEFVIIPKFVQGTDLEKVYNLMVEQDIDQLNTQETSKAGKANVLTLWDNDGVLTDEAIDDFRDALSSETSEAVELFSYNNLYKQQDVPQHMDTENKAGIQIMKKILDNIVEEYDESGKPTGLYAKKKELMDAYSENIKESFAKLMETLDIPLNENGYPELEYVENSEYEDLGHWKIKGLNYEKLFKLLKDEARRTGVNSNVSEFFELDKWGNPLMPPFMSNVSSKLESIIQSLFNNNITRQKLPGFHAAQVTGVGIANKWTIKSQEGYFEKKARQGIKTSNNLRYHPVVNGEIQAYAEVIIPKPDYLKNVDDDEALKFMQEHNSDIFIGYRIPTEGKQSVSVMKVVGFLDKSQGSTIIVPDDWVSQTGADFDVDSIYAITMTPDKDGVIRFGMDNRRHRNNLIVKNMIDILSDPASIEENLSCSNFKDIIDARDEILEGTPVAKQKSYRSPYNFFDQADYQEDAMSGARLKGMSVTRDTLCSVSNTVKPFIGRPITVIYSAEKVKYEDLINAFGEENVQKSTDGKFYQVKHNTFGWSRNNRNVSGRLITAYSSQTTAHILDAIKEGNIPNVNELTFGIYKMFPDLGSDYRTAVSFMMTPGVSRVVSFYNANRSIYAEVNTNRKNDNRQFVMDAVRQIAVEQGIAGEFDKYSEILQKLEDAYGDVIKNTFGIADFSFVKNSSTDRNIPFNAQLQIDRIKERGVFKKTPVERLGNYKFTMTSGGAIGSDYYFGQIASKYNVVQRHFYHGQRSETNAPYGNEEISQSDYKEGSIKVAKAAARNFGYQYATMKDDRLVRNWAQVKYADAIFAVGEIANVGDKLFPNQKNDTRVAISPSVKGGTGYAVGMAINENKPVFVFDQNKNKWFKYDYSTNNFVETSDVVLTPNFAGIGTREINENGKQAIEELFKNTFENHKNDEVEINNKNNSINAIYDLLTIFQYQYLAKTAQQVGDYARVLNPDKFGAKVTAHATRKTLNDIRRLIGDSNPILYVHNKKKVSEEDVTNFINNFKGIKLVYEEDGRFANVDVSKGVLNSQKTILSNEELLYWNEQGLGEQPRILVASERTDPAFHTDEILDVIEGRKTVKQWGIVNGKRQVIGELKGKDLNGLYLITKHDGLPIRRLLQTDIPKLIHFSITGLGGTQYEPGVMKYNDLLDRIGELIEQGLDPKSITVRIDPIVPGVTKLEDIENIIRHSSEIGIKRIRFSILDAYPNTIIHMKKLGYNFDEYYNKRQNGSYEFHAKKEFIDTLTDELLKLKDKYQVTLGTCAEPCIREGISKEGCLSVNSVNEMLGTSIQDKGTNNNNQRALCSCYGGKVDALSYDSNECASHCVYCYAKHDNDETLEYYNEDGTLKNNIYTRARINTRRLDNELDREVVRKRLEREAKNVYSDISMIEAIYPGISDSRTDITEIYSETGEYDDASKQVLVNNKWISDYVSSTGESLYPPLNYFLKYATVTSILVEEQVFATESERFRLMINELGNYLGRNLTEQETLEFKRYILNQIYRNTEFLQENGEYGSINNSDDVERITGINKPIKFNFTVEDINNPTEKEKEAFRQLTPAQKVLWIKQNARDAGIFTYLETNLHNASQSSVYANTQTITFNSNAIDEESALAGMRKAWKNKIWFVKETVRDLFKYSIVAENYTISKKGITRLMVNSILRDTEFAKNVVTTLNNFDASGNDYLNYIRGHADKLGIPTFDTRDEVITDAFRYDIVTFDLNNKKNLGYKYKIINKKDDSFPMFIKLVDNTSGNTILMEGSRTGDYIIYHPLNKLMPNENSDFSIKESNNLYPRVEFYYEYKAYVKKCINRAENETVIFDKNVNDYKYKNANKVNLVDNVDLRELSKTNFGIKTLLDDIEKFSRDITKRGMFIRNGKLADLRPSVEEGDPNSYLTYTDSNNKQYIIKHIDTNEKRGDYSINDYLAMGKSIVMEAYDNGYTPNHEKIANEIINRFIIEKDSDIAEIVRSGIKGELAKVSDVFYVMPRTKVSMESNVGEVLHSGVIGMANRRAIGDEEAAHKLYEMDQSGINPENIDDIENNIAPTVDYIHDYVKMTANNLIDHVKNFYYDSNDVSHGIDDPDFVKYLTDNPKEFNRLLNLLGDIKGFINEMNFIAKNNLDINTQDVNIQTALNEINKIIGDLDRSELISKINNTILEYLKNQSDDPLIINELYDYTHGYHNIGKVEDLFTDAQEAPIPLMQIVLHLATKNVRADDMKHFKNARLFKQKVQGLIDSGHVDLNKIIDENGRIIQNYNNKLVEDYEKYKDELEAIVKNNPQGKNSEEYIKKLHEYKEWKLKNFHQEYVDEYYREILDAEKEIIDFNNGFLGAYRKYKELTNRRVDILSHNINGNLTQQQKDDLKQVQDEIDLLTSTTGKDHIYELIPFGLNRDSYTKDDWDAVNNSFEAAAALDSYIKKVAKIKDKYFNKSEKDGFRETLKNKLKIVFDYESAQIPDSILANSAEYQDAKRWVELNAKLTLDPAFNKILEEAYKELGVGHLGHSFSYFNLIKARGARDINGIVNGTKFTDKDIEDIKKEQQLDYQTGKLNGYDLGNLIQNGNESPFVWLTSFWKNMTVDGVSNSEYMRIVNNINKIIIKVYDSNTKQVNFSKTDSNGKPLLTQKDMIDLVKLYEELSNTQKHFDTTNGRSVHNFIEQNVDTSISPQQQQRFNEEKAAAEALYGVDSTNYKLWEKINTETIDEDGETKKVPNHFIYGSIKPKNAVGNIVRDADGKIISVTGNAEFMRWIDVKKTIANDTIKQFVYSVPTQYYLEEKRRIYTLQPEEKEEDRQARIAEWEEKNHIFNPYTHAVEPIQCWTRRGYKGSNIGLAATTGSSAGIYSYEPRFAQIESEIKSGKNGEPDYRNHSYVESNMFKNYKGSNSTYNNNVIGTLTDEEKQVKKEFEQILATYAKSSSAKRYIEDGSMPMEKKNDETHNAKWHAKQALHSFGWYYMPHNPSRWQTDIDYEHDYNPVTPGLRQLVNDQTKEKLRIPKRSDFPNTHQGQLDYEAKKAQIESENKQIEKDNKEISNQLMNKNWVDIMERFIVQAGHFNSVQENKNLIYFGLDYLRTHNVYKHNLDSSNLNVDKHNSFGNNVNYEKEGYGESTLAVYEAFARRFIFNQFKKDQGKFTKVANILQQMSSAKYMMLNVTGGISNVLLGESQIAMESFANEYFSAAEWSVGKQLWINSIGSFSSHLYDDEASDIGDGLCKLFQTLEFDSITELHEDNPNAAVKWQRTRNALYALQTIGEHFMQNGALLTMLSSHRLIQINDRLTGKQRYVAWSYDRYIRDLREQALKNVISNPQDFDDFVKSIKEDPNDVKDYAWRKKDLITQFVKTLSRSEQEKFIEEKKKLEKDAKEKFEQYPTLFDQFELKDGYAEFKLGDIKDGIILSNLNEDDAYRILGEMKNKVISVNKKIHGVYDKLGASRLEQEWYGGLVMQYHKHIWPGIMKRWRRQGYYNEDRQSTEKGAYWSIIDFLSIPYKNMKDMPDSSKSIMTGIQNYFKAAFEFLSTIKLNYQLLPNYEQANIRRVLIEICAYMSAVAASVALKLAADDDDEKDGIPYNMAIYLTDRFASETIMYTPTGAYGEAKTLWSSPIAAQTNVSDLLESINVLSHLIIEGDDFDPTYRSGIYAGQNKVKILWTRNIPIVRSGMQVWRLPKNNKYYKRQSNGVNGFSDVIVNLIQED